MEEAKQKPTANPTPLVVNVPKSTSTGPVATTPTTGRFSILNSLYGNISTLRNAIQGFCGIELAKLIDIVF